MFKRRPPKVDAVPPTEPDDTAEPVDVVELRNTIFELLSQRVGPDMAVDMREDFDHHLESDPITGPDQAYACLVGKMIKAIDRINDLLNAAEGRGPARSPQTSAAISDFTFFRKD